MGFSISLPHETIIESRTRFAQAFSQSLARGSVKHQCTTVCAWSQKNNLRRKINKRKMNFNQANAKRLQRLMNEFKWELSLVHIQARINKKAKASNGFCSKQNAKVFESKENHEQSRLNPRQEAPQATTGNTKRRRKSIFCSLQLCSTSLGLCELALDDNAIMKPTLEKLKSS